MLVHQNSNQRGFTLIEVLVSVAVVAVLTAIAVPELKSYRKRAYDSVALSYMRNAVAAMTVAVNDADTGQSSNGTSYVYHTPISPESPEDFNSVFPGLKLPDDMLVNGQLFPHTDSNGNVRSVEIFVSVAHCKGSSSYSFQPYSSYTQSGGIDLIGDQIYVENIECNAKGSCFAIPADLVIHTQDGCN